MTIEYKQLPVFTKDIDTESRIVVGIGAVNGNIDAGLDMSINGAFEKRWNDGSRKRQRYLWNHNGMNPPIATIIKQREVSRAELPDKVLQYAPEATGGVEITRKYYPGGIETLPGWVFHSLQMGDVEEMSYAYEVHDSEMRTINGKSVRILKDIETFDWSDVNWGMNGATAGVKGLFDYGINSALVSSELSFIQHSDAVVSALEEYTRRAKDKAAFRQKEGRVFSAANRERLSRLMAMMQEVGADLSALMDSTMPKPHEEDMEEMEEMSKRLITPVQYLALLSRASKNRIAISLRGQ